MFYVGDKPGLGQVTKLANNMMSAAGMLAAFESSAMAVKAGVDARTLIDTVNASTGRNATTHGQVSGLGADAQLRLRRQGLDHVQGRVPLRWRKRAS